MIAENNIHPVRDVLQGDQLVEDALSYFYSEKDAYYLIVMDSDEVIGVLDRKKITRLTEQGGRYRDEMIGNLGLLDMRLCRIDDDIDTVRRTFQRSDVEVIVVTDANYNIYGLIFENEI